MNIITFYFLTLKRFNDYVDKLGINQQQISSLMRLLWEAIENINNKPKKAIYEPKHEVYIFSFFKSIYFYK
jgi:hypothetical protein